MFSNKVFAERVKELRKEKNIKQAELGKIVGLTYTAISDIERGRRVTTMEKLYNLAEFFDVSTDYLLGRTDNPKISRWFWGTNYEYKYKIKIFTLKKDLSSTQFSKESGVSQLLNIFLTKF